nr:DUF3418 domain-containing protein [Schaalia suimastitidis]
MIGHTQPRRIAARSVADRIASELGQKVGRESGQIVGYQVRFTDEVGPTTMVKLMTDGILLAEIQSDPLLQRYDTLIIDEAHERSLNIDFILGYLARLLPMRRDLKVIITSATIDSARFATHFGTWEGQAGQGRLIEAAPVIEVSGRTYPVEIRYRPLSAEVPSTFTSASGLGGRAGSAATSTHDDTDLPTNPNRNNASVNTTHTDTNASTVLGTTQLVLEDPDDDLPTLGYGAGDDIDVETAICSAVDELCAEGDGDILVFLPGERDIRDVEQALCEHLGERAYRTSAGEKPRAARASDIEIVPLYARLSAAEQQRVFEDHQLRRIVLATNVAETSLTVPGIRYVIDPGFARISRYSNRTKVQRLPIEQVSQASANQRSGRCGRVADGIAIRLYSQRNFETRPAYTEPEILRTSLASVILQMLALGLGSVEHFPFLDPPNTKAVRDGMQLLTEIGAVSAADQRITPLGRDLARLPIDPRLGRMLLEADANGCASEVLVIVAALSIQDVRERPLEHQDAADRAHERFIDRHSDFITYLNLWRYLHVQYRDLSGSAFRRMCRAEFLHYLRFREWRDVVMQLRQMARPLDLTLDPIGIPSPNDVIAEAEARGLADAAARAAVSYTLSANAADAGQIHRSLLVGLLSNLGNWDEAKRDYQGARDTHFTIWPGSGLSRSHPAWVMAAELVETSRLFARTVSRIEPEWVEPAAKHLVRRIYSEPYWSSAKGAAMVKEKVVLYGMTLVADRPVLLGRLGDRPLGSGSASAISLPKAGSLAALAQGLVGGLESRGTNVVPRPVADVPPTVPTTPPDKAEDADASTLTARQLAREMLIRHGLVRGEWRERHRFQSRNDELVEQAREVERRSRTHGLVADEESLVAFFDDVLPDSITSAAHFNQWWKQARRQTPELLNYTQALLLPRGTGSDPDAFPDHWVCADMKLPLSYQFTPGSARDGVTMTIPLEVLGRVSDVGTDWLVPGMRAELATEAIRALPKAKRRLLAPAPEVGQRVAQWMRNARDEATSAFGESSATRVDNHAHSAGITREKSTAGGNRAGDANADGDSAARKKSTAGGDGGTVKDISAVTAAPTHGNTAQTCPTSDVHSLPDDDPMSLSAALGRLAAWGERTGKARRSHTRSSDASQPAATSGNALSAPNPTSAPGPSAPNTVSTQAPDPSAANDASAPDPSIPDRILSPKAATHLTMEQRPFAEVFADAIRAIRGVDLDSADMAYMHDHLPAHLHMTFVVTDRSGKEVGAGTDLLYLQKTLAQQANDAVQDAVRTAVAEAMDSARRSNRRRSVTQTTDIAHAPKDGGTKSNATSVTHASTITSAPAPIDHPSGAAPSNDFHTTDSLHRDGLTTFPPIPLPRVVEQRADMLLRGYPALVPQGDAQQPRVGVRLMASPADADRHHREALALLLLGRLRLATKRVTTRWSGREALMLTATPYGDTAALVDHAQWASCLSLLDDLCGVDAANIRDAEAFEDLVARARDLHEDRVYELLGYVVRAMEAQADLDQALRTYTGESLTEVRRDIAQTVARLLHNNFVLETPFSQMPHLARYIRAGALRLQRVSQSAAALSRDSEDAARIHTLEAELSRCHEMAAQRPFDTNRHSELEQARWMLEELRVSLFAQQLGTPMKVSAKRVLGLLTRES